MRPTHYPGGMHRSHTQRNQNDGLFRYLHCPFLSIKVCRSCRCLQEACDSQLPGGCYISIEPAGPSIPDVMMMIPTNIRLLSAFVIQTCVMGEGGVGGFTTYRLESLIGWLRHPTNFINPNMPAATAFLTVSVSNAEKKMSSPGAKDPSIPLVLSQMYKQNMEQAPEGSEQHRKMMGNMYMYYQAIQEGYLSKATWWELALSPAEQKTLEASDKMTYECDAGLGSPTSVDCAQLEWSDLGANSDSVSVAPGVVTFLHQGTCNLAITATTAIVLTWQQIRAALSTLVTICVDNPTSAPQGGRAFYGTTPPTTLWSGRRRKRQATGLNALPPGGNITVFAQKEPWRNSEVEMDSCTWKAITKGIPISTCPG